MKRKILGLFLTVALVCSLLPSAIAVSASQFTDVEPGSWYSADVEFAVSGGYFKGISDTEFQPQGTMSRAMLVTAVARYAKAQTDDSVSSFPDVPTGQWYTGAVTWANQNGIVTGRSADVFDPSAPITREDLATVLARFVAWYEKANGVSHVSTGTAAAFTDNAEISVYAREAVTKCQEYGLLNGMDDGSFQPKGQSTRAQIAAVLHRLNWSGSAGSLRIPSDYVLKWQDEFDGSELNRDDWNVELHDPGWVNAELQAYVDSAENIFLRDGKLVLHPVQIKNDDGTFSYTSGRVNTQNKHDFTYGLFVAKARVPKGTGYLPAFWMMPQDENLYGQWPRCGEIDIMEIHGSDPVQSYGTIHYGNPHNQNQGTYTSEGIDFSKDFHEFALEWLPGELIWYVDGVEFYRTSDWYTATEGQGTITYPAPFDQPFHVILNLAVGGSWVGYPDDATFQSSDYEIDYVRIYQKAEGYDDSNVKAPVKEPVFSGEIENRDYIVNGNCAQTDLQTPTELDGDSGKDTGWTFLTAQGGEASAAIENQEIRIQTQNAGEVDYSVQLVQPDLPMQKGAKYKVSFDAWADAERTLQTKISAPDHNYAVYWGPETVNLTTEKQTFSYEFQMTGDDDANGRLEFNMGAAGSTAGIHLSNIIVEKTGYASISETNDKTVLADGNYVYNGKFEEGDARLGFWDIKAPAGSAVSVTPLADGRRLKITAAGAVSAENPVIISQKDLALTPGEFAFSCEAQGEAGTEVSVTIAGTEFSDKFDGSRQTIRHTLTVGETPKDLNIQIQITAPGTFYVDNVRLEEDSLIKNGSFQAGFSGYEPYVDGSARASYVVDSLTEENAANFGIEDTGDQDWKIQLKQNNVQMERGQWYRLSFNARSTIDRKIMYAIQRDGSKHGDDWTPYCQETIDLTKDWQTFSKEFQMTEPDDPESVLSITLGAVGGIQITDKHDIYLDQIVLEKIEAPK